MTNQETAVPEEVIQATEQAESNPSNDLRSVVAQMRSGEYQFPNLGSEEQMLHYLKTDSPVKIEEVAQTRTAEIPNPNELITKIQAHIRSHSLGVDPSEALDNAQAAQRQITRTATYLTEGRSWKDNFGLTSSDHEVRKEWRVLMNQHYPQVFNQAYENRSQLRNNNMTGVTGDTVALVDTLAWTDISDETATALQDLAAECEELSERAAGTGPTFEERLDLVRAHEDLATKTLTTLKEHFDKENDVPTQTISIT